jgi:hypothetical protein
LKRGANAAERRYLARVASEPCVVCSECCDHHGTPALVHHVHFAFGWGRTSHYDTMPLCHTHHVAPNESVHGMGREEFTRRFGRSELDLLHIIKQRLEKWLPRTA